MKILVATEKPFAAAAVNGIKNEAQAAGHEEIGRASCRERV